MTFWCLYCQLWTGSTPFLSTLLCVIVGRGEGVKLKIFGKKLSSSSIIREWPKSTPPPISRNLGNFLPGAFYSTPLHLGTKEHFILEFGKVLPAAVTSGDQRPLNIRKYSETWSNCNKKRNLHRIKKVCRARLWVNIYEMYWDFRFIRIVSL